jgi:serine/threonine protein kinase
MVGFDSKIYLIDFGLAQHFRDPRTQDHIPQTRGNELVGTIRYASINSHKGIQQSRRDDLESLAYTLLYLLHGKLPWQGLPLSKNQDQRHAVLHIKQHICKEHTYALPSALATFFHYTRSLAFDEEPDYVHMHALIQKLPT